MKRISYELYDPNLTISENAQKMGCSISALKKYLQSQDVDRKFDAHYVRWKKIQDYYSKNKETTLKKGSVELNYSINTIRKYKSLTEDDLYRLKRDTIKVSTFDICNKNSIKSISYNQTEILAWIMTLYNNRKPFECDLTASKCIFWQSLPIPNHLFDMYPQVEGVKQLFEADNLNDGVFNSIVFDLPFLIESNTASCLMKKRFTYFSSLESLYKANDEMLQRSCRLLKDKGLLVVKTMDFNYLGKQIWISDHIVQQASKLGFELIDKFILLAKKRFMGRAHQQKSARKYHSYFFVFRKCV